VTPAIGAPSTSSDDHASARHNHLIIQYDYNNPGNIMAKLDSYIRANLKPKHLHLLVALDDFRNIGKVAASLNVTQPAVSKALAELEKGLDVKLFERTARGVQPTIYGECLIRHARTVLANLTQARDELNGLMSGASGNVRIGALSTAVHAILPQSLALMKERSPNSSILVREGTIESLLPDLWSEKLDIIVGRLSSNQPTSGLEERVLCEETVTLISGLGHPLTAKKRLHWPDLEGYPWVLPPVGTLLRGPLERAFEHHGVPMPANSVETLSVPLLCSYLRITNAIAFLGRSVSKHYQDLGLLAILPLELPRLLRPIGMFWSQQRSLSPSVKLMIKCMEDAARKSGGMRVKKSRRPQVPGKSA
jgi:DNA-binding transcriptional LysR family regulator